MKAASLTTVTCYHCGDPCAEEHRVHDGKDFCCHGCEAVYDLLNEAGLCDYYALEQKPGVKQRASADEVEHPIGTDKFATGAHGSDLRRDNGEPDARAADAEPSV